MIGNENMENLKNKKAVDFMTTLVIASLFIAKAILCGIEKRLDSQSYVTQFRGRKGVE